uniref:Homing endonuclease LAGLIDADG domain-containing protein n=1 Tax=Caulerpa lentillifera TaxID=148947 RepID=A0A2Z2QKU9_9CHLO|nr:hypothetical protein [Caulerpa lentillifera]AST24221.1 hypothetical protein [Caulerpa lentillifera]QKS32223.1 hypothetical protein [Caulerpa lentillifera]
MIPTRPAPSGDVVGFCRLWCCYGALFRRHNTCGKGQLFRFASRPTYLRGRPPSPLRFRSAFGAPFGRIRAKAEARLPVPRAQAPSAQLEAATRQVPCGLGALLGLSAEDNSPVKNTRPRALHASVGTNVLRTSLHGYLVKAKLSTLAQLRWASDGARRKANWFVRFFGRVPFDGYQGVPVVGPRRRTFRPRMLDQRTRTPKGEARKPLRGTKARKARRASLASPKFLRATTDAFKTTRALGCGLAEFSELRRASLNNKRTFMQHTRVTSLAGVNPRLAELLFLWLAFPWASTSFGKGVALRARGQLFTEGRGLLYCCFAGVLFVVGFAGRRQGLARIALKLWAGQFPVLRGVLRGQFPVLRGVLRGLGKALRAPVLRGQFPADWPFCAHMMNGRKAFQRKIAVIGRLKGQVPRKNRCYKVHSSQNKSGANNFLCRSCWAFPETSQKKSGAGGPQLFYNPLGTWPFKRPSFFSEANDEVYHSNGFLYHRCANSGASCVKCKQEELRSFPVASNKSAAVPPKAHITGVAFIFFHLVPRPPAGHKFLRRITAGAEKPTPIHTNKYAKQNHGIGYHNPPLTLGARYRKPFGKVQLRSPHNLAQGSPAGALQGWAPPNYLEPFFVGLFEAAGLITYGNTKNGHLLRPRFQMNLKLNSENEAMVELIRFYIGGIRSRKSKKGNDILWVAVSQKHCCRVLKIFDKYPLLTTSKICQYDSLKKCMSNPIAWCDPLEYRYTRYDKQQQMVEYYKQNFNIPQYFGPWLSGFIEAKGRFKSTNRCLSLSLSHNDWYILNAIKTYFQSHHKLEYRRPKGRRTCALAWQKVCFGPKGLPRTDANGGPMVRVALQGQKVLTFLRAPKDVSPPHVKKDVRQLDPLKKKASPVRRNSAQYRLSICGKPPIDHIIKHFENNPLLGYKKVSYDQLLSETTANKTSWPLPA